MNKKTLGLLIFLSTSAPVWSCPFDEAGIEVTILAHNTISDAIETGNYANVRKEIIELKYLYDYFEESSSKPLYQPLLDASDNKDPQKIKELLNYSLVLEIDELLTQVDGMFGKYQKSRLRLIKANKHLKVLTSEIEPRQLMKKILKSIGNPGLMGMGEVKPSRDTFVENKQLLLDMIS